MDKQKRKEYEKQYYLKNRERLLKKQKKYHEENIEKEKEYYRKRQEKLKNISIVYKLICKKNNKIYIGTTNDINHRMAGFKSVANNLSKTRATDTSPLESLYKDILKYGIDNFDIEPLEKNNFSVDDFENRNKREIYWINFFKKTIPEENFYYLKKNIIIGDKIGELTVLGRIVKDRKPFYNCICSCGEKVVIRADNLDKVKIVCCGKPKNHMDLYKKQTTLFSEETIQKRTDNRKKSCVIDGVYADRLNAKIPSSNTSGVKGVHFDNRNGVWIARIGLKNERIYLGRFPDKESAIQARKEAEEKYYRPILQQYKKGK